jgi:hypothetical protein
MTPGATMITSMRSLLRLRRDTRASGQQDIGRSRRMPVADNDLAPFDPVRCDCGGETIELARREPSDILKHA